MRFPCSVKLEHRVVVRRACFNSITRGGKKACHSIERCDAGKGMRANNVAILGIT
jgi:hypothetical protein